MLSSTGSQVYWMSNDMCTKLHPVWSRGSVFSGNGWGIEIFTQLLYGNSCSHKFVGAVNLLLKQYRGVIIENVRAVKQNATRSAILYRGHPADMQDFKKYKVPTNLWERLFRQICRNCIFASETVQRRYNRKMSEPRSGLPHEVPSGTPQKLPHWLFLQVCCYKFVGTWFPIGCSHKFVRTVYFFIMLLGCG